MARLVKAEIVSLIAGFSSIRAWEIQPRHSHGSWEQASFKASGEALDIHCLYKEIRIPFFHPCLLLLFALPFSSSSTQVLIFSASRKHSTMSGSRAQGKWMASSVKEKDITKLQEPGYLAKEIAHRLLAKGKSSPPQSPVRGWCLSPISSVG